MAAPKEQGSEPAEADPRQRTLSRNYLSKRGEAMRRNSLALPCGPCPGAACSTQAQADAGRCSICMCCCPASIVEPRSQHSACSTRLGLPPLVSR